MIRRTLKGKFGRWFNSAKGCLYPPADLDWGFKSASSDIGKRAIH